MPLVLMLVDGLIDGTNRSIWITAAIPYLRPLWGKWCKIGSVPSGDPVKVVCVALAADPMACRAGSERGVLSVAVYEIV